MAINFSDDYTPRDEALDVLSDTYKEIYGFRPRGIYNFDGATTDEIWDEVRKLHERDMEARKEKEARNAVGEAKEAEAMKGDPLTYSPFAALRCA